MKTQSTVKPMSFWQSLFFFMIPGLYGFLAQYVLLPSMVRLGISEENAYNTVHITLFIGLFLVTILVLRVDGWPLGWTSIKERLRIKRMDSTAWK
jgi:hypothetical protein